MRATEKVGKCELDISVQEKIRWMVRNGTVNTVRKLTMAIHGKLVYQPS